MNRETVTRAAALAARIDKLDHAAGALLARDKVTINRATGMITCGHSPPTLILTDERRITEDIFRYMSDSVESERATGHQSHAQGPNHSGAGDYRQLAMPKKSKQSLSRQDQEDETEYFLVSNLRSYAFYEEQNHCPKTAANCRAAADRIEMLRKRIQDALALSDRLDKSIADRLAGMRSLLQGHSDD